MSDILHTETFQCSRTDRPLCAISATFWASGEVWISQATHHVVKQLSLLEPEARKLLSILETRLESAPSRLEDLRVDAYMCSMCEVVWTDADADFELACDQMADDGEVGCPACAEKETG